MESIEDIVSEARAFRLAIGDWAKGYAATRQLTPSPSDGGSEDARADLRRWSRLYVAPLAALPA